MTVELSIPCVVAGHGRCMGVLSPTVFVSSHNDIVDEMSVPVVAMPTPVPHPVLTSRGLFSVVRTLEF